MKEFITHYWLEVIFGLFIAILTGAIKKLFQKLNEEKEDYSAVKAGMLSLLRAELIRSGEKYISQSWVPIYAKDAYDKAYKAYHGLGGNGTMTELYTKVMALPTVPPKEEF
ncbi:MAG: hypothetical protein IJU04_03930 [Ruminococcus sp.]|nr:hypothetical protein [Ruminococcus sp.]